MPLPPGDLIVINGTSSSGRTSIAKALLRYFGSGCIYTSLDEFSDRMQRLERTNNSLFGILKRMSFFQLRDGSLRLSMRFHREVVDYCQSGHDVIMETALIDNRAFRDAAQCFAPLRAFFVGVKPPLEVSEQWELQRDGDRPLGQVRKYYDPIHAHGIYDLILDPSVTSYNECARAILKLLDEAQPDAFRRLLHTAQNTRK